MLGAPSKIFLGLLTIFCWANVPFISSSSINGPANALIFQNDSEGHVLGASEVAALSITMPMQALFLENCPRECDNELPDACINVWPKVCELDDIYSEEIALPNLLWSGFQVHHIDAEKQPLSFEKWREDVLKREGGNRLVDRHGNRAKSLGSSFNFASVDCGAKIVDVTKDTKLPKAILRDNRDEYLLFKCHSEKFVVIELCEEILIENVEIVNFEFFSSMFREVRLFITDHYPSERWKILGTFQANNTRSLQRFEVPDPKMWSRFLKVEFVSHYGNEFFCPISSVRVYGATMIQEFRATMEEMTEQHTPNFGEIIRGYDRDRNLSGLIGESSSIDRTVPANVMTSNPNLSSAFANLFATDALVAVPFHSSEFDLLNQSKELSSQESVFKMIVNRLNLIELNSTLARRYLDERIMKLTETLFDLSRNIRVELNMILLQAQDDKEELGLLNTAFLEYARKLHNLLDEMEQKVRIVRIHLSVHYSIQLAHTIAIVILLMYVGGRFQGNIVRFPYSLIQKSKIIIHRIQTLRPGQIGLFKNLRLLITFPGSNPCTSTQRHTNKYHPTTPTYMSNLCKLGSNKKPTKRNHNDSPLIAIRRSLSMNELYNKCLEETWRTTETFPSNK